MGFGDTEVYSCCVNERLISCFFSAIFSQIKVAIKLLNRLGYKTLLVIQKTKFQVSISLGFMLTTLILRDSLHLLEVFLSSINVSIFRMSLSQLFVSLQ